MCSGCSLTQPWPHLLPLSPFLHSSCTFFLGLPLTNQVHHCLRPFAHAVLCAWNDLPLNASWLTPSPLSSSLFKYHLIRETYQTRQSKTQAPPSHLYHSLSLFLLYSLSLPLSPVWKVYLLACFEFSMPPEFKLYEFQQFVFWGGRRRSNAKV